ncbi:DUF4062 domain-containing protein [Bacillus mycoides]|uniref:DUF4062 domain-containing protein n=1 Tax=Bacillus mycoides (strain KBAB4) TaxID=315730 RepID=A9VJZ5_BACMK|nr:DUF4062 domain-containing protein [Bacillus mycoides]ABY42431.1 hypothetical protein BcerKBAB4_1184 [Bacillus mycoides KBAB4]
MASPKVFVSSTCYDLRYIRENLKYFIRTLGYATVLSEEGDVFYNPKGHTHDSCLEEIPNCQIFVLVIGGRYGGKFKETDHSITNAEYKEAVKLKIPIFTLVEQGVYSDHHVYTRNKKNDSVDYSKIFYPSADNNMIFDFIDEVRKNSINNAIVPFRNFADIEAYLKKQWAGMMYSFLTKQNEEDRLIDTLSMLGTMNERIELLSKEILNSVGTRDSKITIKLYDEMIANECIRDLGLWQIKPSPVAILLNETIEDLVIYYGKSIKINDAEGFSITHSRSELSQLKYEALVECYNDLKESMVNVLKEHNISIEQYIKEHKKGNY